MLIQTIPLIISGIVNILVALGVLVRDPRRVSNIAFFLHSIFVSTWTLGIAAFLMTNNLESAESIVRIYYFAPLGIGFSVYLFAQSFPDKKINLPSSLIFAVFLVLGLPILLIDGYLFSDIVLRDWGKEVILNRSVYVAYTLFILITFVLAIVTLYKKSKTLKGLLRNQARLFINGYIVASIIGTYFNLFLPLLGNYRLIWIGPLATTIYIASTGYSIVKHRMFDIRLIIARSVGYLLSVVALGTLYVAGVYLVLTFIVGDSASRTVENTANIILLILAASTFGYIRKGFDKLTSTLFYRDAYDPQAFIDNLNRVLVNTVDIQPLLEKSAKLIQENIKAEFCTFAIRETSYSGRRIIGSGSKEFDEEDVEKVRSITPHIKHRVIITDELADESIELTDKLRKYNISIMARLVTTLKYEVEGAGYLLLGPKKSGNPYNQQDIKIIRIISNELVIAIQNALRFEEIEKFNITLQEKVDNATKKLKNTNEQLKKMDETKDEFISMASHQLRTPLTSVKGYLSMVLEGDVGDITDMQRKLLDQAFVSSQRMVYLIADLLNVSRLRTGKFVIESSESNLAEVVASEVNQLKQTAAGRGLELTYDKPENFPVLYLDETKLRQVIMNFTDNAIYYTPSGGHIVVKLEDKGESIELTVNDDGMGVPKSEQPHLFSKFYRAGNAKKARPDGTGLGLFMARKVIIAQGGHVIFNSREGKGSTFGFSFPKTKLQVPSDKVQDESHEAENTSGEQDSKSAGGVSLAEASVTPTGED